MIFNIQRYSLHDGDGLRSTVFLKGCPLHCPWCSNPESQKKEAEIMFDSSKCIGCQDCIRVSKNSEMDYQNKEINFHPHRQGETQHFKDICPSKALQVIGEKKSAEEICNIIKRDLVFYKQSGGGVTLSGGEPLMQAELCREVAQILKKDDIPLAIETCLHIPWENIKALIPYTDEFICDLKHSDPIKFKEHTGGNLKLITNNLKKLDESGTSIRIRIPIIYGFNHDRKTIGGILDIIQSLKTDHKVEFLPYHSFGAGKYEKLGRSYDLPEHMMPEDELLKYIEDAEYRKIPVKIGG
ncbi:MAG: glycyl-radical enzyme activating protein [Spirochaetaceae bacterium]